MGKDEQGRYRTEINLERSVFSPSFILVPSIDIQEQLEDQDIIDDTAKKRSRRGMLAPTTAHGVSRKMSHKLTILCEPFLTSPKKSHQQVEPEETVDKGVKTVFIGDTRQTHLVDDLED